MPKIKAVLISLSAYLTTSVFPNTATAEQAFVCDKGRIVYATMRTVEILKKTDACVAKYFGLTVKPQETQKIPLPIRKPLITQLPLKPSTISTTYSDDTAEKNSTVVSAGPAKQITRQIPTPAAPVDFRNIPIINAKPGSTAVFKHKH